MKDKIAKLAKSPWAFFINKRPVSWLLVIAIIVFGATSLMSLPREIQPEIEIPIGAVSTALPGANPSDVESLITEPLESSIGTISEIKNLSSTSGFGFSSIVVEFEAGADLDTAIQDLKDAVDSAKNELPDDATDPNVVRAEANEFAIITFSIIGNRSLVELTTVAENIQDELEKIKDVSKVELLGGQSKQIHVILDQKEIENYPINIQDVSNAIKFANNNLPVGVITTDELNYSVRIDNRFEDLNDIRNVPIYTTQEEFPTTILLKDIATIEEAYPDQSIISKLSIEGQESKETIALRVYKKKGSNLIQIADSSKEKIEELKNDLPDDIQVSVSNDNSLFIREDTENLTKNGLQTTGLIIIILFLALGLKEGFITGLSIPLTFMIAFTVLNIVGMTINSLSLFSLVIALGLMVDTAIVIMEGIYENLREGYSSKEAALLSVDTYKWPLIAGTMTSIFAFFPMLLVSGILGEFLKTLPITISAALFSSLFISLTIGPSLSAKFLKQTGNKPKKSILGPLFDFFSNIFGQIIKSIIKFRIFRFLTIVVSLVLFVLSMMLPVQGILKTELFPVTDAHYFIINIETPTGVPIEKTEAATKKVEELIYDIPEVDNFVTIIGSAQGQAITDGVSVGSASSSSNLANITVNLSPKNDRERKSYEITKELSPKFENIPDAKVKLNQISEGPPTEAPITIRLTGEEIGRLQEIADDVEQIVSSNQATQNVNVSLTPGLNEFKYTLDKDKLAFHGLSAIQVSGLIRNIVQGVEASTISLNDEDLDIIVKYQLPKIKRKTNISISDIENFQIQSPKGYTVTLDDIGGYEFGESLSQIDHEDQKRIIKITSDIVKEGNVVEITDQIVKQLDNYELPKGYEIKFGGDLEEINESFQELYVSMAVGILLIAFTLVLMFNSFKQPFIILLTLPLALIGVFPGLLLVGLSLSFPAFLGVVALTGVVVNDAIVLIDRINKNREKGELDFVESIAEASKARMQPILMTSITTIVGILPLALTNEFWAGLGFALIFGLACATMLTLVVMPVLYYIFEIRAEKKNFKKVQLQTLKELRQTLKK